MQHPLQAGMQCTVSSTRLRSVVLEGQDVGGDAVQEPAVVRDDKRGARKARDRILQRAQRLHIQVVLRLILRGPQASLRNPLVRDAIASDLTNCA